MKRFVAFVVWSLIFLALLVGLDQFFVRGPSQVPVLAPVRTFYLDFRQRLWELIAPEKEPTLETVIGSAVSAEKRPTEDTRGSSPRYLYVDADGELRFADTLEEIPAELRSEAKPLAE